MAATRDPANLPRQSSGRLAFAHRTPAGELVYLSAQQRALLLVLHAHIGRGRRARLTTRRLAAVAGYAHPGNVTRALDRLASFGIVGRQAIRGRAGEVRVWLPSRRALALRRAWVGNVAASTPFGGFVTREGLARAAAGARGGASAASRGRPMVAGDVLEELGGRPAPPPASLEGRRALRRPPRVLYVRCPGGHRTRICRSRYWSGFLELEAEYRGRCGRCGREALERIHLAAAGGSLRAPIGSAAWRGELEARHGEPRVAAFLAALRRELVAGGALHPGAPPGASPTVAGGIPADAAGGIPRWSEP